MISLSRFSLLTVALALVALPAGAATPLTGQQTEKYLGNCMSQPSPTMDTTPQKREFCECTALQMQKHITVEDIAAQSGNDQAARDSLNKTITQVYSPCIQYPIYALVMKRCMADANVTDKSACTCSAKKMAEYTAQEAQGKLPAILAANPNVTDPSEALMGTPEFEAAQKQIADTCGRQ